MHFSDWLSQALGNWQGWLSGGGIGGLVLIVINLIERFGWWQVPKKWYAALVLAGFFCGANYVAWNSAFLSLKGREADLAQKDRALQSCGASFRTTQNSLGLCLVQLGKVGSDSSLPVEVTVGMMPTTPDLTRGTRSTLVVAMISKTMSTSAGTLKCDKPFRSAEVHILGAGIQSGGTGRIKGNSVDFGIGSPASSPAAPLIFTVFHDEPIEECSVDLQKVK